MKPISMALAATLLIATVPALAQQSGDSADAKSNVQKSQQYDRDLKTDPGFRKQRMAAECGSIQDQDLKSQCMSSFPESSSGDSGNSDSNGGTDGAKHSKSTAHSS